MQTAADSRCVSLLNCVSSAYGLLVNVHWTDNVNTVCHSLTEVGYFAVLWMDGCLGLQHANIILVFFVVIITRSELALLAHSLRMRNINYHRHDVVS